MGCIPIVSNSYALPEVVGDCGIIINEPDNFTQISDKIRFAISNYNYEWGLSCVNRINNRFSQNTRGKYISELLNEL